MDTDRHGLLFEAETRQILGSAMEVLNTLGHGLLEKPYERALVAELALRGIPASAQSAFEIRYKGVSVGTYIPDLIVFDKVIVEIKCIDRITAVETGQIINYLKIAKLSVGLILNFKRPRLEWERVVV